jgi:hypothetical protein
VPHALRRSDRATRVQTFGIANAADFAPGSKATLLFPALDSVLENLLGARVGQLRTPVGKPALLDALFADFKDIARTSRAIALEEPGFSSAAYRFPADYTEAAATTHADSLLTLLEDNTAAGGDTPAQLAAKAPSASSSSPSSCQPTSSRIFAPTATPSTAPTPASTATTSKASKAPPPPRRPPLDPIRSGDILSPLLLDHLQETKTCGKAL